MNDDEIQLDPVEGEPAELIISDIAGEPAPQPQEAGGEAPVQEEEETGEAADQAASAVFDASETEGDGEEEAAIPREDGLPDDPEDREGGGDPPSEEDWLDAGPHGSDGDSHDPDDGPDRPDEPTGPIMDPGRMVGPNRAKSSGSVRSRRGWNLGYFIREGFVSIFRHGFMSFAAVCMTVACLLIMGTFSLVAVNLDANLTELERDNELLAYMDDSLSDDQVLAMEERLAAIPNVRTVEFVDRVDVLEEFRDQRSHENELYDLLPDDTFQHRYRVHVDDIGLMEETVERVKALPGVESTSADLDIAEGMIAVRNVAAGVALILVAILAVVSLFIIANTLRLATFYRRDEIAIMRMCGATNGFICWPFVMEGAMLGLFSAGLAFGLQWWVYDMLVKEANSAGQLGFLVLVDFSSLWTTVLATFCAGGLVIGVLGSLLAIRRFLRV